MLYPLNSQIFHYSNKSLSVRQAENTSTNGVEVKSKEGLLKRKLEQFVEKYRKNSVLGFESYKTLSYFPPHQLKA